MRAYKLPKITLLLFALLSFFANIAAHAADPPPLDDKRNGMTSWQNYNQFSALNREYADLINDINNKIASGQEIDWDQVAAAMGVPSAPPDATFNKLKDLYDTTNTWVTATQTAAANQGVSLEAWLDYNGLTPEFAANCIGQSGKTIAQCVEEANQLQQNQRDSVNGKLNAIKDKTYDSTLPPKGDDPLDDTPPGLQDPPKSGFLDITQMLQQIRKQIPSLVYLVYALCYLTGFALFIMAIFKLKTHGENLSGRGGMGQGHGLLGPIVYAMVATSLIYFPTIVGIGTNTFMQGGGDGGPLSYPNGGVAGADYESLYRAVIEIIKLVGVIAFFRGWLLLVKLGNGQAQQGTLPKSLLHLVGGVLAVNIVTTWDILRATFGYVF